MSVANELNRIGDRISKVLVRVAFAVVMSMMLLTTVDVLLRYVFDRPIKGAFEVTELMMLMVVALSLGYTQYRKGHIFVELVSSRLPSRAQAINDVAVWLVCLATYALIAWQAIAGGQVQQLKNVTASDVVRIPLYPFYYLLAFGCVVLWLAYLSDIVQAIRVLRRGHQK